MAKLDKWANVWQVKFNVGIIGHGNIYMWEYRLDNKVLDSTHSEDLGIWIADD